MDDKLKQKLKNYVLWLLGRQEYSRRELTFKLQQKEDSGLGLQNIKNRISSIGGNLQIDTHEGYGTLITIEVDFKEQV